MRGFLHSENPFEKLVIVKDNYRPLVESVENLFSNLTSFLKSKTAREEIVCNLREVVPLVDHEWTETFGSYVMEERAFLIYSCFAASFVNSEKILRRLAKEITIPLVRMGARVHRHPVLDYQSYILSNWRLVGNKISKEGIEPLFTFSGTDEEKSFITSRIIVENNTSDISSLDVLEQRLDKMLKIMQETPKFPLHVVHYLNPFINVQYEGWGWVEPRVFDVPLIAQSPTISFIARLLGVSYSDTDYTNHRPSTHNQVIASASPLEMTSTQTYNKCLEMFAELADLISDAESGFMWNRFGTTKKEFLQKYRQF